MSERGPGYSVSADPYSPRRRTALVLTGTGTAGAYHAGVLRALHEAGVKIDVVAGLGVGVIGALFAAVDGSARLWEEKGFWRSRAVQGFYGWRPALVAVVVALAVSLALVLLPLAAVAAGLVVFPIDFLFRIVGLEVFGGLVNRYVAFAQAAFSPAGLPTWLPRLVLLVMIVTAAALAGSGWVNSRRRRQRDPFWWRVLQAPLSSESIVAHCWAVMWDLVRGAAPLGQPEPADLARRYIEMLSDNLGQPGFRELLLAVHDVDARRDLVFALTTGRRRERLRLAAAGTDGREGDVHDLSGLASCHLPDAIAGALSIPLATDYRSVQFAADSYWRGEAHRLADRPASLARLVEELAALDVAQVLLVSAAPESAGPHALRPVPLHPRARLGEYLQSAEAAIIRDVVKAQAAEASPRLFTIRPLHNPIDPLEFAGAFDERSERSQPLGELLSRGYEDAYRQFIDPVVGGSGEGVGRVNAGGAGDSR